VQQARRQADFAVSDRIHLTLGLPDDVAEQISGFMDYIRAETLAETVSYDAGAPRTTDLDGTPIAVAVERLR
jgi:isoleucyl-tRNA synthetase